MKMVMGVMWYAPVGIMSLIAARLAGNENFWKLLGYDNKKWRMNEMRSRKQEEIMTILIIVAEI